jgi:hypothetical protein
VNSAHDVVDDLCGNGVSVLIDVELDPDMSLWRTVRLQATQVVTNGEFIEGSH